MVLSCLCVTHDDNIREELVELLDLVLSKVLIHVLSHHWHSWSIHLLSILRRAHIVLLLLSHELLLMHLLHLLLLHLLLIHLLLAWLTLTHHIGLLLYEAATHRKTLTRSLLLILLRPHFNIIYKFA